MYCNSSSLEERFKSKAYLDLIQKSTLIFVRKHEVALLYSKLGGQFNSDIDLRIDCYKSAAENFAKSKDWQKFCDVELSILKNLIFTLFLSLIIFWLSPCSAS